MTDENPGSADAGNPAAAAAAAAAGQPNQTPAWTDSLPEDLKGFALNKGWDSGEKALVGYRELEKFVGADKAGRAVVLPGESATPEEQAEFHRRIGVPAAADGYKIEVPADFPDQTFAATAQGLLHKHHIPKANGEAFMADVLATIQAGQGTESAAELQRFQAEEAALKDGWGADFGKNIDIAKRGAKKLGFSDEIIDQLEAKAGFAGVIKALHAAGVMLGEGRFVDSGGAGGDVAGAETLEQLQARRSSLVHDKAWSQRYHANEPTARREYDELNRKIASLSQG